MSPVGRTALTPGLSITGGAPSSLVLARRVGSAGHHGDVVDDLGRPAQGRSLEVYDDLVLALGERLDDHRGAVRDRLGGRHRREPVDVVRRQRVAEQRGLCSVPAEIGHFDAVDADRLRRVAEERLDPVGCTRTECGLRCAEERWGLYVRALVSQSEDEDPLARRNGARPGGETGMSDRCQEPDRSALVDPAERSRLVEQRIRRRRDLDEPGEPACLPRAEARAKGVSGRREDVRLSS